MIKHFFEIKNRLFLIILSSTVFLIISYYYSKFFLILSIFSNTELVKNNVVNYFIFTSITDLFSTHLILSVCITNYLIYFNITYHLICFLKPGLFKEEFFKIKRVFYVSICLSLFSFILSHILILPIMSKFFLGFGFTKNNYISFYFEANIYSYFMFYKGILFNCFVNLQISILFFISFNYYVNNLNEFGKTRRFFYFILLILSTLLTPPDLISQMLTFLSAVLLFEAAIFSKIVIKTSNNG